MMTGYKNCKDQKLVKSTIIYIFMVIFGLIAIVPVRVMLINVTRNTVEINAGLSFLPSSHALDNWRVLTSRGFHILRGFHNSAEIAVSTTLLCVYFSSLTAYAIHVYRFPGCKVLWGVIMTLIMLPASLPFIDFIRGVWSRSIYPGSRGSPPPPIWRWRCHTHGGCDVCQRCRMCEVHYEGQRYGGGLYTECGGTIYGRRSFASMYVAKAAPVSSALSPVLRALRWIANP